MEFVEKVGYEQYNDFVFNHAKNHFLQSYDWGKFAQTGKKLFPHYVGLKDKGKLVATALLLEKRLPLGFCYFYSPRGYIIDFENKELLKEFTNHLKKFAKKKKALFIKLDPDIKLHSLNSEGTVVESGVNNQWLIAYLKSLGYKHLGFNKNFENSQPRYTFRLNLKESFDDIKKNFHSTTKNIINRGNPYNLTITKNDKNTIEQFYKTMIETAKREGIVNYSLEYYKDYYEIMNKVNMSDLYVVTVDVKSLKKIYFEKVKSIEEEIEKLESGNEKGTLKYNNKKQEFLNQMSKAKKEYDMVSKLKDENVVLSSMLTAKYGNKVWTLYGGNNSILRELNANYLMYYEIIKDAKNEKYEVIDFFGTTGNPVKQNHIYGIHLFKKRLGGEYTEFVGEFDLIVKPFLYFCFINIVPFYRRIIRNIAKRKSNN